MTSSRNSCSVCDEALTAATEAFCGNCGLPYHLNQRQDTEGKDCGQVWISEEHLALEFACDRCLHPEQVGGLDDVLDLAEAAQAVSLSEATLAAAADRGEVAHRKTGSGVYLFQRRDLPAQQGRR
jgi:hypothetical protein